MSYTANTMLIKWLNREKFVKLYLENEYDCKLIEILHSAFNFYEAYQARLE